MAKARKKKTPAKQSANLRPRTKASARRVKQADGRNPPRQSGAELLTPTIRARELFWSNVVREILMSLWAASDRTGPTAEEPNATAGSSPTAPPSNELLDGRFSVVTNTGLRVPIAQVQPVFGCGVLGKENREHWLSQAVECTVFQIRTPQGEVFTLPVHAVRAFHSLSEESMQQLGNTGVDPQGDRPVEPFGFAAYTSLAKSASTPTENNDIDPRWIYAGE